MEKILEMFGVVFYTIFLMALGVIVIKYRKIIHDWTGDFAWAQKYLGRGGTYFIILLIGLGLIFYGATYPFGGALKLLGN